jgi:hypothetical protein
MKTQIRGLIAEALHSTSLFDLAARCEHYGLEPGKETEAVASKKQYVLRRLEKLSDQEVLQVANLILADLTDDRLQSAVEAHPAVPGRSICSMRVPYAGDQRRAGGDIGWLGRDR